MAKLSDIHEVRAERFAADLLTHFANHGAYVVEAKEVGDPELWRSTARRVAHEHGRFVVTGYYGPADELVWAKLYDHPATAAERTEAKYAVEYAVIATGGPTLSSQLLPD